MLTPTADNPLTGSLPAQALPTDVSRPAGGRKAGAPAVPSGMWRTLAYRGKRGSKLPQGLDAGWNAVIGWFQSLVPRRAYYLNRAKSVLALEKHYCDLTDADLRVKAQEMRDLFRLGRQTKQQVDHAFAVVREVAWRQLGMKPYKVQVAAALAMYNGCIAELATGEGKTLSASMPATVVGWRGRGCHVITVNDYLAARDAELMRPVYAFCGLNVASVVGDTEQPQRREGYLADITYTTNKESAADFLRDRLALGDTRGLTSALARKVAGGAGQGVDRVVQRGLEYAIVDEADSVMIDEAVTPLIISGAAPNSERTEAFKQASEMAQQLESGADYEYNPRYKEVTFTKRGRRKLAQLSEQVGGVFAGVRRREEMINQALVAREVYLLDKQYVIQEGKIVIVDDFTGRLMPDREWRDGLHQAVTAKEGLEIESPKETLCRLSFQNFFRFYKKLGGMTGTAWEARQEMWQIYGLPVVRIPTNRKCIRKYDRERMFVDSEAKWTAIRDHIIATHETGQPMLVGTRSVRSSERLSRMLSEIETPVEHRVLNAVRHKEESQVVAEAGRHGNVTLATNMAGRGTDIKLGRGVAELGGLHVVSCERHESARVDRQLFGRSARQGDPGVALAMTCLDDELLKRYAPRVLKWMLRLSADRRGEVRSSLKKLTIKLAQRKAERMALSQRKSVLKTDDWLDNALGFTGSEM